VGDCTETESENENQNPDLVNESSDFNNDSDEELYGKKVALDY